MKPISEISVSSTQYCCATCEFYDGWACSLSGKSKREEMPACKCFELMAEEVVR